MSHCCLLCFSPASSWTRLSQSPRPSPPHRLFLPMLWTCPGFAESCPLPAAEWTAPLLDLEAQLKPHAWRAIGPIASAGRCVVPSALAWGPAPAPLSLGLALTRPTCPRPKIPGTGTVSCSSLYCCCPDNPAGCREQVSTSSGALR